MADADQLSREAFRAFVLRALIASFAVISAATATLVLKQVAGADYSCFWAGAKAALSAPAHLYDFAYVSELQHWPLGPGSLRPYIYPPSALPLFIPFTVPSYWVGYGLWVVLTGAVFLWAGVKAGAPWWLILLPSVAFVAYCGQITFLIGALIVGGLALRHRPVLAGLLFGVAAAVKPQLLIMLPFALLGERAWKTIFATAAAGAAACAFSVLVWGLQPWRAWLAALGRFQHVILDTPSLVANSVTPYAALSLHGLSGAWVFPFAPLVAFAVWLAFRRGAGFEDRLIALLGGALLISPYAMNYEVALFAPAVAAYLARTKDRAWPVYVAASLIYVLAAPLVTLLAVLALPMARIIAEWQPERKPSLGAASGG